MCMCVVCVYVLEVWCKALVRPEHLLDDSWLYFRVGVLIKALLGRGAWQSAVQAGQQEECGTVEGVQVYLGQRYG